MITWSTGTSFTNIVKSKQWFHTTCTISDFFSFSAFFSLFSLIFFHFSYNWITWLHQNHLMFNVQPANSLYVYGKIMNMKGPSQLSWRKAQETSPRLNATQYNHAIALSTTMLSSHLSLSQSNAAQVLARKNWKYVSECYLPVFLITYTACINDCQLIILLSLC